MLFKVVVNKIIEGTLEIEATSADEAKDKAEWIKGVVAVTHVEEIPAYE